MNDITPARLRDLADEGPLHTRSWKEIAAALRAAADQREKDEAKYDELYGIHHDRMQALGDLLAIIHRDGGHHTDRVGYDQAVNDAHQVWTGLMSTLAAREVLLVKALDLLAPLECTAQLLDDWGTPRTEPIPNCEAILIGRRNHGHFDVSASTDLGACRRARALAAEIAAALKQEADHDA